MSIHEHTRQRTTDIAAHTPGPPRQGFDRSVLLLAELGGAGAATENCGPHEFDPRAAAGADRGRRRCPGRAPLHAARHPRDGAVVFALSGARLAAWMCGCA
eukprot:7453393-Pyramimonas_sp.AAC.1